MRERLPALMALLLLITLVGATWWAAEYAQRAIPVDPPRRLTHEVDAWAQNFVMLRTDAAGMPINRLEGTQLDHYPDDDSYEITAPRAVGQQANQPVTVGTAQRAIMDEDGSRITLIGKARLERMPDGERQALRVESEQIVVRPDDAEAYTDLPAVVTHGRSRMTGTGMRYNNKTRQLQVLSATDVQIAGSETRSPASGSSNTPPDATP